MVPYAHFLLIYVALHRALSLEFIMLPNDNIYLVAFILFSLLLSFIAMALLAVSIGLSSGVDSRNLWFHYVNH